MASFDFERGVVDGGGERMVGVFDEVGTDGGADRGRLTRPGGLEAPPAHRVEGFNPLCGDEVIVYLGVDDGGNVTDIKINGQGCSISQSSASMMSAVVKGKSASEVRALILK